MVLLLAGMVALRSGYHPGTVLFSYRVLVSNFGETETVWNENL